ncbi:MAG: GtrA family protein [Sulfurimonas sp.]|nr:GtrA family protein [Sulfurimonas sp.]
MLKKQIISFLLVGIINTIVGYSLYALFIYLGFSYILSVLFATILGVLFNFKTIGKFVFKSKSDNAILKFILVYSIVFVVNIVIIKIFKGYEFNDYLSGLFAIIPASAISFILNKYYVFKDKKK